MLAGRSKRPLQVLYQALWRTADLVYPPYCGGCGKFGLRWCHDCQAQLEMIDQHQVCRFCGIPLGASGVCSHCRAEPPAYQALRSCAIYQGPLRQAIHALKYRDDLGLGETFSSLLLDLVQAEGWPIDLVTCVPLSPHRMAERGYNQASQLARPLAYGLGKPFRPYLLERTRETPSQVKLTRAERILNMQNAFQVSSNNVAGRSILIVDDVSTTGATMLSCARALANHGTAQIFGITLARAVLQYSYDPFTGAPD